MTDVKRGLSRRTMIKGAAWSVPVVAAAFAAPMAAASANPQTELRFFLTAGEVIGQGASTGQIRSNGVRISPADPSSPKVIAAGTVFEITIEYHGTNPAFDFLKTPYGVDWNKQQSRGWTFTTISSTKLVLSYVTSADSTEPTGTSFSWVLDPSVRPEDGSVSFSGVATIARGGDYPDGGVIPNLLVDPNGGTGSLSGPTAGTWPV